MSGQPRVSVIIPVYNAEDHLRECLESVTGQTLRNIEILCVDDGSTDGSPEILRAFAAEDPRIRVLRQDNAGPAAARNRALSMAAGRYVHFLDSDDAYAGPGALKSLYRAADREKADVCGGSLVFLQPDGGRVPAVLEGVEYGFAGDGWVDYAQDPQDYYGQRFLFRRAFLLETGVWFHDWRRYEDPPFLVETMLRAGRFYAVSEDVYLYRISDLPVVWTEDKVTDLLSGLSEELRLTRTAGLAALHGRLVRRIRRYMETIIQPLAMQEKASIRAALRELRAGIDPALADPFSETDLRLLDHCLQGEDPPLPAAKTDPLVSVIVPVFNAEKHLEECLDSLLGQTLRDLEILCVDDGSSDRSWEILQAYARRDDRIRAVRRENQFAGVARNCGLRKARGKYLVFLDADDFFEPTLLEKQVGHCESEQAEVCICGADQFDSRRGQTIPMPWMLNKALFRETVVSAESLGDHAFQLSSPAPWNKIFLADFIRKKGISFQNTRRANDLLFVYSAVLLAERITYVDEVLVHYRVNGGGSLYDTCRETPTDFLRALLALRQRLLAEKRFDAIRSGFIRELVSECEYNFSMLGESATDARRRLTETIRDQVLPAIGFTPEDGAGDPGFEALLRRFAAAEPPKVSVVVPVYNVEPWLRECLNSLIYQSLREIEILCVNDGSTDGSRAILSEAAGKDSRIRILDQENGGLSRARNAGARQARGKYLLFVDSDDYIDGNALEILYSAAETSSLDVLLFDGISFYDPPELEPEPPREDYCVRKKEYGQVCSGREMYAVLHRDGEYKPMAWLMFLRRGYYEEAGLSFREGILHEDVLFSAQCILSAGRISHRRQSLYHYRRRPTSIMGKRGGPEHIYGNFVSLAALAAMLAKNDCDRETAGQMASYIRRLHALIEEDVRRLGGSEPVMRTMSPVQRVAFQTILGEKGDVRAAPRPVREDEEALALLQMAPELGIGPAVTLAPDVPEYVKKGTLYAGGDRPAVSVVIPAYNGGEYLRACLESAAAQTLKEIEIICVNDGSWDGTLALMEELAAGDPRVTVVSRKNGGLSRARNEGVQTATGEYVCFLDADDMLRADALETLYARASREKLDLLFFDGESLFDDESVRRAYPQYDGYYHTIRPVEETLPGPELLARLRSGGEYRCSACMQMIRMDFYREKGLGFEPGILHEDNLFSFRCVLQAERAGQLAKPFYLRRIRRDSIMTRPVRFENLYGYLRCAMGMMDYVKEASLAPAAEKAAWDLIGECLRQVRDTDARLPERDGQKKTALTAEERFWLNMAGQFVTVRNAPVPAETPADGGQLYREEIERIHASASYKIGRFMTWPARKIRTFLRCWKENGARYTFRVYLRRQKP